MHFTAFPILYIGPLMPMTSATAVKKNILHTKEREEAIVRTKYRACCGQ